MEKQSSEHLEKDAQFTESEDTVPREGLVESPHLSLEDAETIIHERRREIRRDLLLSLVILVALLAVKVLWIEHTYLGKWVTYAFYDLLQHQLTPPLADEPVLPVIVDISDLPDSYLRGDETIKATPREELRQIVQAVANRGAVAIGVDIDFSVGEGVDFESYIVPPRQYRYITPDDPEFLEFCLNLRDKAGHSVPVFLGVGRALGYPPEEWLGGAEFQLLAASIWQPEDAQGAAQYLVYALRRGPYEASKITCPSMAQRLAETYRSIRHEPSPWLGWAMEVVIEKQLAEAVLVRKLLVDFSPLETLMRERIHFRDISKVDKQLRNRIVLIGDATIGEAKDTFIVPDHPQPVPGVYLHACAAYTLLNAPLYHLTKVGRIALDLLLALIVLGTVFAFRWYYSSKAFVTIDHHKIEMRTTIGAIFAALVFGVFMVRYHRVMWDDFLLVALTMLIHPVVEQWGEGLLRLMRRGR